TSACRFVTPQAICSLCPLITPGTPGRVAPVTFSPGAFKCARYQVPGIAYARCGSFASIGFPFATCAPETAQLFEPGVTYAPCDAGNSTAIFAGSARLISLPLSISNFDESVRSRNITNPASTLSVSDHGRGSYACPGSENSSE